MKDERTEQPATASETVRVRKRIKRRRRVTPNEGGRERVSAAKRQLRLERKQPRAVGEWAMKKRLAVATFLLLFGGFLACLGYSFRLAYCNSQTFQARLESILNAERGVTLRGFEVGSRYAEAERAEVSFGDGSGEMVLQGLRADHSFFGLMSPAWHPQLTQADEVFVVLPAGKVGGMFPAFQPSQDGLRVDSVNVGVSVEGGERLLERAKARFSFGARAHTLQLSDGSVLVSPLKGMELSLATLRFRPDGCKVSARFTDDSGLESVQIAGEVAQGSATCVFRSELTNFQLTRLLENGGESSVFTKVFNAALSSDEGELSVTPEGLELEQAVKLHQVSIAGFDCFRLLSKVLKKNAYRRPVFYGASTGRLHWAEGELALRDLDLQEDGLLRVRGDLRFSGNADLSGDIEIGVPERYSQVLRERFTEGTFVKQADGYLWQRVLVSGAAGELEDDLRSMLRESQSDGKVPSMDDDEFFHYLLSE